MRWMHYYQLLAPLALATSSDLFVKEWAKYIRSSQNSAAFIFSFLPKAFPGIIGVLYKTLKLSGVWNEVCAILIHPLGKFDMADCRLA